MKSRLLAVIVAAGGILVSAGGFAMPLACSNYTTVGAWASAGSCVDNLDGDLLVTWVSNTIPNGTGFTVDEFEIGALDLYDVGFDWSATGGFPNGYAGGGGIQYTVTSLTNSEQIGGANFDTIVQGTGAIATKQLFDIGNATPFLTLTSTNGSRDPAQGETSFGGRTSLVVVDTFNQPSGAVFLHADNSFSVVPVPEPASLALVGLGLAGMGLLRRRRKLN